MTLTAKQKTDLNRMNRAAQNVALGTVLNDLITSASSVSGTLAVSAAAQTAIVGASASHVVTSAEASASRVVLTTGLTTVKGFIGQSLRSGSPVLNSNVISGSNAGTLVFMRGTGGSALPLAANDVVTYIAW